MEQELLHINDGTKIKEDKYKMNKLEKVNWKIEAAIIGSLLLGFIVMTPFILKVESNIKEKYTKITVQDEINGVVTKLGYKKYQCLEIDNHLLVRFNVQPLRIESSREMISFSDIVQKGDSLIKRKDSDTVFIVRNDQKYIFPMYDW